MSFTQAQVEPVNAFSTNKVIHSFLERRGLSHDDIDYLLHPNASHQHDPFLLRGIQKFIDLLHSVKGQPISVVADYDADGVLSGTVARVGLSLFGFGDVYVYAPKTFDGYGITKRSVNAVMKARPETKVILTTDNGSNAHEGIAYAKSLGLTVLVTDHHLADADPMADAVVNPNRRFEKDQNGELEQYPFTEISGTAVVYKTLLAYGLKYITDKQALLDYSTLVLLVGISTISDVMPLLNENRYFVTQAVAMLERFVEGHSVQRIFQYDDSPLGQYYRGVDLLVMTLNKHGKLKYGIDSDMFGFIIGPMLNSPRRMVGESQLGFDLFQTTRRELFGSGVAQVVPPSDSLFELNETRKAYVRKLTTALLRKIEISHEQGIAPIHFSVFNIVTGAGIAGLLSGAYTKQYHLPSVAFSVPVNKAGNVTQVIDLVNVDTSNCKTLSGSARSSEGFDIHAFLTVIDTEHPDLIKKWGGHAGAAGITIEANKFDEFRAVFVGKLAQILLTEQSTKTSANATAVPELEIGGEFVLTSHTYDRLVSLYNRPDAEQVTEIQVDDYTPIMSNQELVDSVRFFEELEPFGNGFPKPMFSVAFSMKDVRVYYMGTEKQHAKVLLPNGLSVIHWNGADVFRLQEQHTENGVLVQNTQDNRAFIATGSISINEYNGNESLQLIVEGLVQVE